QVLQGRYRILGIIGMGGMGAVYQARDLNFTNVQRLCAVKEMINLAQDQSIREQTYRNFEREAEILATLDHPAIPKIYDYFSFGDRAYLVQEYIQGRNLEEILNSTDKFLPVEQVRVWGVEICDVLEYLHNHEPEPIVFRDMKPSNVMIDHLRKVRLIDFGIAKTFQMNQPGTMIGTEGYSPPEQYKGMSSPAADIYALGATLHHLLTRRDPRLEPPFSFDQRPMRDYNPNVSEALSSVVMRSLAYDPNDRFGTADAFKQSLEASANGGGAPAAPQNQGLGPAVVQNRPTATSLIRPPQPSTSPVPAPQPMAPQPQQQQVASPAPSIMTGASEVTPLWSFQVEDAVRSTPVIVDRMVCFGSYDNNVWAIDIESQELIWKFPTEGGIGSSPIHDKGVIYVGSADGRVYALDARSGKRRWDFKTEGKIFSTPLIYQGIVYIGSDDGHLYAIKGLSGAAREVWSYDLTAPIRSSAAISNDRLFIGSDAGELVAMDLDAQAVWRFATRRRILSTPMVRDEVIYFGSDDWQCYAVDFNQGYPLWRYRTKKPVISSPAYAKEKIFFGSADGTVTAVDAMNGRERWQVEVGGPVTTSPEIAGESLYIATATGDVFSMHVDSGNILWHFKAPRPVLSSPRFHEDVIYFGCDDKRIYALQA
ncbi:MAG: serine/threonine-protein kinase, partial [Chloroflexi bacterium]|nr:serine/threonine-protein kinase [Chloroflexota bacterium]